MKGKHLIQAESSASIITPTPTNLTQYHSQPTAPNHALYHLSFTNDPISLSKNQTPHNLYTSSFCTYYLTLSSTARTFTQRCWDYDPRYLSPTYDPTLLSNILPPCTSMYIYAKHPPRLPLFISTPHPRHSTHTLLSPRQHQSHYPAQISVFLFSHHASQIQALYTSTLITRMPPPIYYIVTPLHTHTMTPFQSRKLIYLGLLLLTPFSC